MLYLSQLLGTPVADLHNERAGKIVDIRIPSRLVGSTLPAYPNALVVEGEEEHPWFIPFAQIERSADAFRLLVPTEQLEQQPPLDEQTLSLAHDVLDKQVIDIKRKKAIRVNDVCLGDDWQILGIDNSTLGLIRRLAPAWLLGGKGQHLTTSLVSWDSIEPIATQRIEEQTAEGGPKPPTSIVPRVTSGHLAELHPADIAEIVHQLTPGQGARLIETLDDETAADTMEEIDTERQRHILENIQAERAADILQAMGPDEAADLLSELPEERAQELLHLMTPEESEEVQELLAYEEDTAGGLMTTDYIVLNLDRTATEALEAIRANIREYDIHSPYIYCVADETQDESRLLGVVSLWELLVAAPTEQIQGLMETDMITVQPDSDAQSVAEIMAKYNLLAVPVVNVDGVLEGIVTVDDALDVLLPPERRRKPTRMY